MHPRSAFPLAGLTFRCAFFPSVSALENKILGSGGPSSSGTQAIDTGITAKLTDASTYQATHAQRFDADGKGKGLAGRDHPSGPTAIGGEAGSGTISSYKA